MKKLQTKYAKEVPYQEISGTPGLLLRRGNTRHSYEWFVTDSSRRREHEVLALHDLLNTQTFFGHWRIRSAA